jgi:hypothetical protein
MQVDILREPKLSKIDHLFVLLAEGNHDVPWDSVKKAIRESKFEGRSMSRSPSSTASPAKSR